MPRPVPAELLPWALAALGAAVDEHPPALTVVAGDASNRRYFRLQWGDTSYMVAEAPPATEKNEAFVTVRNVLSQAGVRVPIIYAIDFERGYLLLEDLGDSSLLPALSTEEITRHSMMATILLDIINFLCRYDSSRFLHITL